jgi:hypothetical protein
VRLGPKEKGLTVNTARFNAITRLYRTVSNEVSFLLSTFFLALFIALILIALPFLNAIAEHAA